MADDFVNNFGLLGQVLFKKRNEREARQKLDEALSRELAKIAAQAGYEKEIVDTRERGAKERAEMGETGARERQAHELALREKLAQDARQAEIDSQGRDFLTRLGAIKTEYNAKGELNEADWNREKEHRAILAEIARRKALADGANAAAQVVDRFGEIDPALAEGLTGVRMGTTAGPVAGPTKTGRIKLPSSGGTPPKPGETSRTPNNAAPEIPVQVGPKPPTAETKFDSAGSLGTGLLNNIRGNTWGIGPDSKNMQSLVEAYLQKSAPAEPPSILDALGKELSYDQRRPAIKK